MIVKMMMMNGTECIPGFLRVADGLQCSDLGRVDTTLNTPKSRLCSRRRKSYEVKCYSTLRELSLAHTSYTSLLANYGWVLAARDSSNHREHQQRIWGVYRTIIANKSRKLNDKAKVNFPAHDHQAI